MQSKATNLIQKIQEILDDRKIGQIIREGIDITILGLPNSGKSTLLNSLARQDLAIVSDIPGTTRDIVSSTIRLGKEGIIANVYDTAGLR